MRAILLFTLTVLHLSGFGVLARGETRMPEAIAVDVVHDLVRGRFAEVTARFAPGLARALPAEMVEKAWHQVTGPAGPFKAIGIPRATVGAIGTLVAVPIAFEKASFDVNVTFGTGGVVGLFIRPPGGPAGVWVPPAYADLSKFDNVDIAVGAPPDLPGVLSLPKGVSQPPVVLLVHGSGPGDRDESIGPNRPFADIADGLATRGIAVLRYDKRTRVHPVDFAPNRSFTVQEEVIDDVQAGVDTLADRQDIDRRRIIVLGHSLGATLAPRIVALDEDVAAAILMAPAARPLPRLVVEQSTYIAGLAGPIDAATQKRLDGLREDADRALAAQPGDMGQILGASASYWADLNAYDPVAAARGLYIPILVLQGGRDYQVTQTDYDLFQKGLAGHSHASLRLFPNLNHLFMAGEGKSRPEEYLKPGHVDAAVIDAIASFVEGVPRRYSSE